MHGEEIRKARKARGWTQQELADKAGIKQGYLSDIENGNAIPSWETLNALATALNLRLVVTLQPAGVTSAV